MSRSYLSGIAFTAAAAVAASANAGTLITQDFTTPGALATWKSDALSIFQTNGIGAANGGYTGLVAGDDGTGTAPAGFNAYQAGAVDNIVALNPAGGAFFNDNGGVAKTFAAPVTLSTDSVVVIRYSAYSNIGRVNGEDYKVGVNLMDDTASGLQFRSVWSTSTSAIAQNPNNVRSVIGNGKASGESDAAIVAASVHGWDGNFNNTDITAGNDAVFGQIVQTEQVVRFVGHDAGALGGTNFNVEARALNNLTGNGSTSWQDLAMNNIGASTVAGNTTAVRSQVTTFDHVMLSAYQRRNSATPSTSDRYKSDITNETQGVVGFTSFSLLTTKTSDFNLDGATDGSDLNIWNTNKFATGKVMGTGDANNDGATDGSDLNIWNTNKFQTHDLIPPEVTDVADVVYDPSDGSLKLKVNTGTVQAALLVQTGSGNISSTTTASLPLYLGIVPAWTYTYFNGKMQYTDGTLGLGGAPIGVGEYLIATLLPNLDASAFGTVEYGSSAGTQFTAVSVIPEPASLAVLAMGGLAIRRRR